MQREVHYRSQGGEGLLMQDEQSEDEEEEEMPYEKFNSRQTIQNFDTDSDSNNYQIIPVAANSTEYDSSASPYKKHKNS